MVKLWGKTIRTNGYTTERITYIAIPYLSFSAAKGKNKTAITMKFKRICILTELNSSTLQNKKIMKQKK